MILITGANRGIGAALLAHYRAEGAATGVEVLGTARQPADGLLPLDVTEPASITALAERLAGQPVGLLICNAGVLLDRGLTLGQHDAALWARSFATNATGPFLTVQALLGNLKAAAPAKVALVSSAMGSQARPGHGYYAYRASKAALSNIGRTLALDLAPEGIAVGIYHPGWVRTDMNAGQNAPVAPEDSAAGLAARFAALGPATSGCFEDWQGKALQL